MPATETALLHPPAWASAPVVEPRADSGGADRLGAVPVSGPGAGVPAG